MRGGGYADVLPVLQVLDNKADAVPCERLQEMITTMNNRTGRMCGLIKQMNHEEYLEYSGKMLPEREIYLDKFEQKLKRRAA